MHYYRSNVDRTRNHICRLENEDVLSLLKVYYTYVILVVFVSIDCNDLLLPVGSEVIFLRRRILGIS